MAGYNPSSFFKGKVTQSTEPIVTYDPTIITKKKKADKDTIKAMNESSKDVVVSMRNFVNKQSKLDNFASVSSGQKSDRIFSLTNAITTKKVRNLDEATKLLNVKPPTVRRYLREMGYSLDGLNNIVK